MDITNTDDVIDSRDVIERIEELQNERDSIESNISDCIVAKENEETIQEAKDALIEWDSSSESEELKELKELAEEAEPYSSDWVYGETLIRDTYFEEYMDDMINDCYEIPKDLPSFMSIVLDYEALRQDYTSVNFGDAEYWIRSC